MYDSIISIDNLYQASKNALKNKKSKHAPAKFWLHQDREIAQMHKELRDKQYSFGGYSSFILQDNGVERRISVAPFRDRVLHHAIMQSIEPLFERSFIYDTYANRKGKGTLAALKRAKYYANRYRYVLQLDIQKFFPSIGHKKLIELLDKKIECRDTMSLLEQLISNSNKQDDAFFYFRGDETRRGFVFLGHKVFSTHFRLTSKAIRRGRKRLKKVCYTYTYGKMTLTEAKNKIFGTIGFFKMGSNGKIIDELLAQTILCRCDRVAQNIK